jgi:hypothetical protein
MREVLAAVIVDHGFFAMLEALLARLVDHSPHFPNQGAY